MRKSLYKNLILCADIVSDIHLDIKHPHPQIPCSLFCRVLKDSKKNNSDAVISVGDTTSRGNRVNWDFAREAIKKYPQSAKNIILTVGNHDCWSDGEDEYGAGIGEYYSACKDLMGRNIEKPYYSTCIKGYSFICLGNESDMGCDADISDYQLLWLKSELETATKDGKPAFVFCHQSLNGRHGLPRTWEKEEKVRKLDEGGVGEKSEQIAEILKSFKNVFYFSGHSHMGICGEKTQEKSGYSSFECENGLHLVNLPSLCCGNHCGEKNGLGMGLLLEIYSDRVCIRPRDYKFGRFIKSVKIKNGKPYYDIKLV